MAISRLALAFLLLCISYAIGHSYVTSPQSRSNQKQTQSGCRGPSCLGPCDVPLNQARTPAVTIARGAPINVQWPRNNHAGGFIRFAWTQTSGSDIAANFDAGVQEIHCHEIGGCGPDDPSNPNGGDSGPSDGSSRACQTTITVPSYLTDGTWTLQWAWFGGAFALGDYYSCVDYIVSGGAYSAQKSPAVYYGGDYSYPGQNKCKFFNTDRLHQCVNEPCNNPVYTLYQEQAGPAFGVPAAGNSQPTIAPAPVTSGVAMPLTTSVNPLTTSRVTPLTTSAKPISLTTQAMTTAKVTPSSTTGTISNPTNPSNPSTVNCAGLTNVIDSSQVNLKITDVDTWSNVFRMEIEMDVHVDLSDWMLQVIWPSNAVDTQVQEIFNAGLLKCSASVPERHVMIAPVANWANVLKAGEVMFVEIRASNTNMDSNFLMSNTQLRLFKK
jgi:hypothetical protein